MGWAYEPDSGGPVEHLDNVFTDGNAPRFHGLLKRLAETEGTGPLGNHPPDPIYIDVWKADLAGRSDGEIRAGEYIEAQYWNEYSILAGSARKDPKLDLDVRDFFYHAEILSGQDVGTVENGNGAVREHLNIKTSGWIEGALEKIQASRACKPEQAAYADGTTSAMWSDLMDYFEMSSQLWVQSWTTPAGIAAQNKFKELHEWYGGRDFDDHFRTWGLGQLAQCLAGFATLIHGARLDIDNLMGVCIDQVHAWNDERPEKYSQDFAWAALSETVGVATSKSFNAPMATLSLLNGIAADMKMRKDVDSGGCYDILANYLHEADAVLDAAVNGVDALVKNMRAIRSNFPPVPTWDG